MDGRMSCNLFTTNWRLVWQYCCKWGWKYAFQDTLVTWWRVVQVKCPKCGSMTHKDRLGRVEYRCDCGCKQ